MIPSIPRGIAALGTGLVAALLFGARAISGSATPATPLPDPAIDQPVATAKGEQRIVFGGGCFWGVQAVFQHVKGVKSATSGYAGGTVSSPSYMQVTTGTTGHAEVVEVVFDSSQVSLGQLLKVFFSVVHDPTQLNRQGPDVGTQYRSAVYYTTDAQRRIVEGYIGQLAKAKTFREPIVTEVAPLKTFYEAEAYHQNYYNLHPNQPYIVIHDRPKVEALKSQFAALWKD
ncbi:MAG TPA: peptide-methionine (S)-S-oxide reductase MsrA [Gemmatimonadaceae bacterium]|nr:peptide-methionine (S)-S-oxide reductase MsrA [Gemmatimonadaceae bacterium]